jgi:hypothetical protein
VTAKTLASDLVAPFKAIDIIEPGGVVVIDAHKAASTAFWGENMTLCALNRGVAAAIIDQGSVHPTCFQANYSDPAGCSFYVRYCVSVPVGSKCIRTSRHAGAGFIVRTALLH